MKDGTRVREDGASGRPAEKPVSSNLLKNRAKENEKAMKSGFMKMPDYARKKFDEEEEKYQWYEEKEEKYKPHMMYKGDKKVMAKKKGDHDRLNKKGYDHDNPETKKVEEEKKPKNCGCGQDPCITYGKGGKMEKEQVNEISADLINKVRKKRKIQHSKEYMDNYGHVSKETQRKRVGNKTVRLIGGAGKEEK